MSLKELKTKIKEQDKLPILFCLLIVLVFFGNFVKFEYATDTYSAMQSINYVNKSRSWLQLGRPILALWWYIISALNFSGYAKYLSSFIIAIFATFLAIFKLNKIIRKDVDNQYLSLVISTIIIINPFTIELFLFIEKGIMMLSVLFAIMASEKFIDFLETHKKSKILVSFIFAVLSSFCYQGSLGLFLVINCVYIAKKSENIKKFIINNFILALTYGVTLIVNFLLVTSKSRVGGEIVLSETIHRTILGVGHMLTTYYIWPTYMLIALLIILAVLLVIVLIKNKEKSRVKLFNVFSFIYIALALLVASVLPVVVQSTNAIWFVPRSTFAFGAIFGLLSLYLILINKNSKIVNQIMIVLITLVLIIQFYRFNEIILDHYKLNYRDKVIAVEINNSIKEYEAQNNIDIKKIGFFRENYSTYSDLFTFGNINESAYNAEWSDFNIFNYYSGRRLERAYCNEEIINLLKSENIVFDGDTVYVKICFDNTEKY